MKYIGAHVSIAGGISNAPLNAAAIGASAFGMFTKNQRRWQGSELEKKEIDEFQKTMEENNFKPEQVLVHDSYLINLGNPNPKKRNRSQKAFLDEARRCEKLELPLLNFHPGSHLGKISPEKSLDLIVAGINQTLTQTSDLILVIETTAGQGNYLGDKFEHLHYLIEHCNNKDRIGVCLDTCHIFGAGYDISTVEGYKKTMEEFENTVGFKYLKGAHLNDSKIEIGTNRDRHAPLGEGLIGLKAFKLLMEDPRFDNIPLILETPKPKKWKEELELLSGFIPDGN
ncbi:MAG: deoxyribonuclease IV [Myxococcota bacterium]